MNHSNTTFLTREDVFDQHNKTGIYATTETTQAAKDNAFKTLIKDKDPNDYQLSYLGRYNGEDTQISNDTAIWHGDDIYTLCKK